MNQTTIFSTGIWDAMMPRFTDIKIPLINDILELRRSMPDLPNRSGIGGTWESPVDLVRNEKLHPVFDYVTQLLTRSNFDLQIKDCHVAVTSAWATVHDNIGAATVAHTQGDTYSVVFYLQVPPGSGRLVLANESLNPLWQGLNLVTTRNKFTAQKMALTPTEGQIIMWPSYIPHWVEPHASDQAQISVSFNVICYPAGMLSSGPPVPSGIENQDMPHQSSMAATPTA